MKTPRSCPARPDSFAAITPTRRRPVSCCTWGMVAVGVGLLIGLPVAGFAAVNGPAAFAALQGLAGTWQGKAPSGETVVVEYKVAAHGTAVIETQSPAAADEMVTVYSLSGPDLVLTHYCPMGGQGNQPRMTLDRSKSTPDDLRFRFVSVTNLDPAKEMHVHEGRLILRDAHHLHRDWEIFMNGKHSSTISFDLTRQAAH
jgi:hypothetical protein